MQNFVGTGPLVTTPNTDIRQLIAADLRCLIAQIETSMRLIDAAMVLQDDGGDQSGSTDVFVLDDVTPRYATASAALGACKASLDLALEHLSDHPDDRGEMAIGGTYRPHFIA
jgi:hypothetical protein